MSFVSENYFDTMEECKNGVCELLSQHCEKKPGLVIDFDLKSGDPSFYQDYFPKHKIFVIHNFDKANYPKNSSKLNLM